MDERSVHLNTMGCKFLEMKDYPNAFKYFCEAAKLGNANGIYNIGYCYFNGYGVEKNYYNAYHYLSKFMNTNHELSLQATYLCGLMLEAGGYGIIKNTDKAEKLFLYASERGHAWASLMYGKLAQLKGELATAKNHFEQAQFRAPNDAELQKTAKGLLRANMVMRFCK